MWEIRDGVTTDTLAEGNGFGGGSGTPSLALAAVGGGRQ